MDCQTVVDFSEGDGHIVIVVLIRFEDPLLRQGLHLYSYDIVLRAVFVPDL